MVRMALAILNEVRFESLQTVGTRAATSLQKVTAPRLAPEAASVLAA
jgi:hypothetical protein